MVEVNKFMEFIKKQGAMGVMAIALLWMNSRINTLEDKLYNCYDKLSNKNVTNIIEHDRPIAIIPEKFKFKIYKS